ncbi:putative SnRNP Sm-like protein [Giardia muris]|uniref:Putative SnRNP Sm-like protein n=1 Tax=Giardia muris TaxID=5742 RepID=A0A4Z1T4L2_GIAMU|nr:putative SnRNP Sm-like protein [Giardia muris]|eukprot:TNJ28933.1 putative SnRNP Sm-like protein [Giardia muris]
MHLVHLLQQLKGQQVKLELKTGDILEGKVKFVDRTSAIYLTKVIHTSPGSTSPPLASVLVRGNAVRMVHFPPGFELDYALCRTKTAYNRQIERKTA